MTTPDEVRAQARAMVDADPAARARVTRAVDRWNARHPTRPQLTHRQAWADFEALQAALEAAEIRNPR